MFRKTLLMLLCSPALWANDPGGGSAGVGADVTLTDNGSTVTLANGEISAVITKSNAKINSMIFNGIECVRSGGDIYFSMDGNPNYRQPSGCTYSVTTNTTDMVDISMRDAWTTESQPLDIEIHYVLRRGDTGIYAYAILDHPASYTAHTDPDGVSEWRMVWKLPDDTFQNLYVDDLRSRAMPSSADYSASTGTGINEVVEFTTGPLAGEREGKYCYNARYRESPAYGHASNAGRGVFLVFGSQEFFNDGPFKTDLAPADRILHVHFGRNHYDGSSTEVSPGEDWSKLYGPYLLYCNSAASPDACWADAKAQAEAEEAAWPYDWLVGNPDFPTAAQRGTVNGTINLSDPLKPALDAEGALVGLAQPGAGGQFQKESKGYQHWTEVGPGGSFAIPHVRPGTYTLYCVKDGVAGEFEYGTPVVVGAGGTVNLGTLNWNVSRTGTWMAWEIGLPDRQSTEFANGDYYWQPFAWEAFTNAADPRGFPNPLTYDVSSSTASGDWNYCQSGYGDVLGATGSTWPYQVTFNLASVPSSGTARLHLAFTGSHYARMHIDVNGSNPIGSPGFFYVNNSRSNTLIRQASNGKYDYQTVDIPVSMLQTGPNTIQITEGKVDVSGAHVMYDYVGLEMPTPAAGIPTDGDGDGLVDSWEMQHFATLSFVGAEDPDGDGFDNAAEAAAGSDPNDAASLPTSDSDGDTYDDATETLAGSDPHNPLSTPLDIDADGLADAWETAHFTTGSGPSGPAAVANTSASVTVDNNGASVGGNGVLFTSSTFDMNGGNAVALLLTTEGADGSTVRSATFAGQPMTEVHTNQGAQGAAVYYIIDPAITSGQFVFSLDSNYSGTVDYAYTAVSLSGVDGFAGSDTDVSTASNDTTPLSVSYTTSTDGGYVLGTAANNDYTGTALAVSSGNPDTEFLPFTNPDTSGHYHVGGEIAAAGSYTDEYIGQIQRNAVATVAFNGLPTAVDPFRFDGTDDPDGDTYDNEAEETAGSDPNDIDSIPDDIDGDDLSDLWELAKFGDLDEIGTGDPDGDGFDNETEENAGSHPDNIASTPDDTDADELTDTWENTHFSGLGQSANDDYDEDGTPEWLEEALALNPKNPNERFASAIEPDGSSGFEITWPNAEGVTFTVRSTTTIDGSWTPEASYPGAASPPQGSHPVDTSGTKRFYSVEAAPAPAP